MHEFRVVSDHLGVVIYLTVNHPDGTQLEEGHGNSFGEALQDLADTVQENY